MRTNSGRLVFVLYIKPYSIKVLRYFQSQCIVPEKQMFIHLIITTFLILFCQGVYGSGFDSNAMTPVKDDSSSPVQIRFGYWNDNFLIDNVFGKSINKGRDDNVTAGFMLQASCINSRNLLFLDIFHSILANKSRNYRTDVIIARFLLKKNTKWGSYTIGPGILSNNNYGGETLQNGYHSLTGIRQVKLPYLKDNRTGITIFTNIKTNIFLDTSQKLKASISHSYRNVILPNVGKIGIEYSMKKTMKSRPGIFAYQIYAGYLNFYKSEKYFKSMFDDGIMTGFMISYGVAGKYQLSTYLTTNQYGLKQPHFGVSFVWNWLESMTFELSAISVP